MKGFKLKKYAICIFSVCFLLFLLYVETNYSNGVKGIVQSLTRNLYATEESETTNKNQSSTSTQKPSGDDMVELLARLINGEARGEPYEGQVAVGAVILNRVKSPQFPNTIPAVIYQNNQFSCIKDGQFDQPMEEGSTVYKAAQEAMNGSDPSNGALYFYNPSKTKSKYLYSLPKTATIGEHVFALGE